MNKKLSTFTISKIKYFVNENFTYFINYETSIFKFTTSKFLSLLKTYNIYFKT